MTVGAAPRNGGATDGADSAASVVRLARGAPAGFRPVATIVKALSALLEARDAYTGVHSRRVGQLSADLAREVGFAPDTVADIGHVGELHDIGKLAIPDAVLRKEGPLDAREAASMRAHPEMGERLVASIPALAHLGKLLRAAHERWDGGGYPDGLANGQIPVASRIVQVCDAYDAMTSSRCYRRALTCAAALDELRRNAGVQFCPGTVAAFVSLAARPIAA